MLHLPFYTLPNSSFSSICRNFSKSNPCTARSSASSSEWYPVAPECELDKRKGCLDVVEWWDRNENAWKVFEDMRPHWLAPLSQGRIDQWARLQYVYHALNFNSSDDCPVSASEASSRPPNNWR
ncbi:hypothetical protein PVL29_007052 [Vitis rotundifolia]|uniref:Rieske domain-containing protein n=1 Tax=Vitis rotundifolia TaxID=103349 RepID=A0AA38ZYW6_VITRO|nr:hypothetical protein PVL29_007052 [Vitis rotundifolia]